MSDVSVIWNDIIGLFKGKPAPSLPADADKFLRDAQKVLAGIQGAEKDAPSLVSDVTALVAEGEALVSSRGLNLPELLAAGSTLVKTVDDVRKAVSDYKAASAIAGAAAAHASPRAA